MKKRVMVVPGSDVNGKKRVGKKKRGREENQEVGEWRKKKRRELGGGEGTSFVSGKV